MVKCEHVYGFVPSPRGHGAYFVNLPDLAGSLKSEFFTKFDYCPNCGEKLVTFVRVVYQDGQTFVCEAYELDELSEADEESDYTTKLTIMTYDEYNNLPEFKG